MEMYQEQRRKQMELKYIRLTWNWFLITTYTSTVPSLEQFLDAAQNF